jgi:hypothetical protein
MATSSDITARNILSQRSWVGALLLAATPIFRSAQECASGALVLISSGDSR